MKSNSENAMSIPGIAFGMFCVILLIGGGVYVLATNSNQSPITDTYGNTLDPVSNSSQDLVTSSTSGFGGTAMIPLIIIAVIILLIAVIAALWVATKTH